MNIENYKFKEKTHSHRHINLRISENVSGLSCHKTDENPLVLQASDLEDAYTLIFDRHRIRV